MHLIFSVYRHGLLLEMSVYWLWTQIIFLFHPIKAWIKNLASRYLDNPAFQNLPAIKEHRVKPLPAAYLYTMNQHIGEAMLAIMHTVYPQLERNPHD